MHDQNFGHLISITQNQLEKKKEKREVVQTICVPIFQRATFSKFWVHLDWQIDFNIVEILSFCFDKFLKKVSLLKF